MKLQNLARPSPLPAQRELIRIRRFAQITVPEEFRERFSVKEGDYIEAEMVPRGMLLKPVSVISHESAWKDIYSSIKNVRPSASARVKNPRVQEELITTIIKTERKKIRQ